MADVKISALPPASTPLSGAELVPVVQGGQTVQTTTGAVTAFLQAGVGAVSRSGQDKMRDIINAKDFGAVGDGIADDTAALQRAIDAAAGRTLVLTGTFRVTSTLNITNSNTHIIGDGAAKLVADPSWTAPTPLLQAIGPGLLSTTTLAADITSSSTTFTVADPANFAPGVFVSIRSADKTGTYTRSGTLITVTSVNHGLPNGASVRLQFTTGDATTNTYTITVLNSNTFTCVDTVSGATSGSVIWFEYWSGITDVAGYRPVAKKELNRVQSVSGSVMTPEWGFSDTYLSGSGYQTVVEVYSFIENVKIENIYVYGYGDGNLNTTANQPVGIQSLYVNDFVVTNCKIENFQRTALVTLFTNNARVTNNEITGRNLFDPSNLPTISDWFYGAVFTGTTNFIFSNNTCQYLRRAIDMNADGDYPIARNGVVSNNTAVSCLNAYGSHFCENIVFNGNVGVNCGAGIYFRGKNCYISNNSLDSVGTSPSGACILVGGTAVTYTDNPSAGYVMITNNRLKTAVGGISVRVDVSGAVISGNMIYGGNGDGIAFSGKRAQDIIISGNHIDITTRIADRRAVYFNNTDGRSLVLKNISIFNNRLKNATDAIRVEGPTEVANAASNIVVKNNTIDAGAGVTTNRGIRFTGGAFASNLVFKDNLYGDPVVISGIAPGVTLDLAAPNSFQSAPDVGDNAFWNYNQQTIAFASSTALQTKLVTAVGQKITNSSPAPGGYMGWVCTTAGVVGSLATINGGVAITGSINSGTNQLTVSSNNNAAIFVGAYITIAGAGVAGAPLATQVTAVNSLVITVANNASTTVAGAAVTYTSPVFKGFGLIET